MSKMATNNAQTTHKKSPGKDDENDPIAQLKKRSYSYYDIIKMESKQIYSSIGDMLDSRKPTAPKYGFGTTDRKTRKKQYDGEDIAKIDLAGQIGNGPASYFPTQEVLVRSDSTKLVVERGNPTDKFKFASQPSVKIGNAERVDRGHETYNYYNYEQDYIKPDEADAKRRPSQSCIRIGLDPRWKSERKDKMTPGPQYDPGIKKEMPIAPKYTFGFRRQRKGQDPLIAEGSTNQIVGPGAYFPNPKKSASTKLLRVPADSRIREEPTIGFTKGPKAFGNVKQSIDETYDIKTGTIMAHYDFEYDGGKGLHSGTAWQKSRIKEASSIPVEKNKMRSYSIGKSTRDEKRGFFENTMSMRPAPVRIQHPRF